jgi:uncharacterized delta-60 repeat protein
MKKLLMLALSCIGSCIVLKAQVTVGFNNIFNDIAFSRQGKMVAVGGIDAFGGALITSINGLAAVGLRGIGVDWQGEKFIVAGGNVGRFNADGSLDASFGENGIVPGLSGIDVKVLCNNKILVAGGGGIYRLLPDGGVDSSFGQNGFAQGPSIVNKIEVQPDGKIVSISDKAVLRFNSDGTVDNSFTMGTLPAGVGELSDLALQSDGKVVAATYFKTINGDDFYGNDFALLRFNPDGSLDLTFSGDGMAILDINRPIYKDVAVAVQNDNKILLAGTAFLYQCPCPTVANFSIVVARFNTDGTLDESFGTPTSITAYGPTAFFFDGKGKTVVGSLVQAREMALYRDSIYVAGGTTPATKSTGTSAVVAVVANTPGSAPLVLQPHIEVSSTLNFCSAQDNYIIPPPHISDNCDWTQISFTITGATNRSGSGSDASGSFNPGISVISWHVTDAGGDTATAQTTVSISTGGGIADTTAFPQGDLNTVYYGYAPASTITLRAQADRIVGPVAYLWNTGSTTSSISVSPSVTTTYTVTMTNTTGCSYTYNKTVQVIDVRCGNKLDKVMLRKNGKDLCVSENAVPALLHTDASLGSCDHNAAVTYGNSKASKDFTARALPNPGTSSFVLDISPTGSTPVKMIVYTIDGKLVEEQTFMPDHEIQFGQTYRPGTYLVQITQGVQSRIFKFVKIKK